MDPKSSKAGEVPVHLGLRLHIGRVFESILDGSGSSEWPSLARSECQARRAQSRQMEN